MRGLPGCAHGIRHACAPGCYLRSTHPRSDSRARWRVPWQRRTRRPATRIRRSPAFLLDFSLRRRRGLHLAIREWPAHLLIFTFLIWGQTAVNSDGLHVLLGLSMGFFYFYQIIDSIRSARAMQLGQPAPDPLGLAQSFGGGERVDTSKIPAGAVVLIILGGAVSRPHYGGIPVRIRSRPAPPLDRLRWVSAGAQMGSARWLRPRFRDRCRTRHLMGPAMMITVGALFLLENTGIAYFDRTWPVILLVIGLIKLLQNNASTEGHRGVLPLAAATAGPPSIASSPVPPSPSTEVKNG